MALITATALSASCVTAFAKTEIPLEDGAVLVVYEEGDKIPMIKMARDTLFSFDSSFPAFPSYNYIHDSRGNEVVRVPSDDDSIRITFSQKPDTFYINVYSQAKGKYITSGTNGLQMLRYAATAFEITNIDSGNYKIGFAGSGSAARIAASLVSFH